MVVGGFRWGAVHLVGGVIGVLVLVATHIAGVINQVAAAGNTLALAGGIKALLMGSGVLAGVR